VRGKVVSVVCKQCGTVFDARDRGDRAAFCKPSCKSTYDVVARRQRRRIVSSFRDLTVTEVERHGFKRQELPTLETAGDDLTDERGELALTYTRNTRRWSSTYVEDDSYQSPNPAPIPTPVRRRPVFVPPKRCDHGLNGLYPRKGCAYCEARVKMRDPVQKHFTPACYYDDHG